MIPRVLRAYIVVVGLIATAATGTLVLAAAVVQRQLDAAGVPDCRDPNVCWPQGAAMDALTGVHLVAALTPALIGLVLGVPVFARRRADDAPVPVRLGWALAAGVIATGVVAVTHRLVTAPYTVIANDYFELTELLHLNHPGWMIVQTALLIAIAAVIGPRQGRPGPALAGTLLAWPVALMAVFGLVNLLAAPFAGTAPETGGASFADDYAIADGFGWAATAVITAGVAALALVARRPGKAGAATG